MKNQDNIWIKISKSNLREKDRIKEHMKHMHQLPHVLFKIRNGEHWTESDRVFLKQHFKEMSSLSPYIIPLVLPGGVFLWPFFAWWLDSRRRRRKFLDVLKSRKHS